MEYSLTHFQNIGFRQDHDRYLYLSVGDCSIMTLLLGLTLHDNHEVSNRVNSNEILKHSTKSTMCYRKVLQFVVFSHKCRINIIEYDILL